ncbi:SDR family NAD(P)-dependent oxidoreductase [Pendulispora albinea]|uniref:SDR family NAD(P)-dependent oxidoreductase n=1 Tax=Pendulispora albinea TaxID=2741071 RepID=A0ABZ2M711_9BACT
MIEREATGVPRLIDALRAARREQWTTVLTAFLRREVARRVGLEPDDIGPRDGFMAAGIDSLRATEIRVLLDAELDLSLPSSMLFDFPNVEALAEKLALVLGAAHASDPASDDPASDDPRSDHGAAQPASASSRDEPMDGPIAIVGMGCRFPGGVRSPDDYWRLLIEGVDATTEIPGDRWDKDAYDGRNPEALGTITTRRGGFLSEKDRFDPAFFNVAPREAPYIDPQHRVLLEVVWEAFEGAGVSAEKLYGSETGVFIGVTTHDYFAHLAKHMSEDEIDIACATGVSAAVASGRISYVWGLRGPSVTLDTACSSALVAVHLACESLRRGECRSAIAGAAAMILSPLQHLFCSRAQMLAPDGRCKSFDEAADGYGRSEGVGVVLLKRVSDAIRDGDSILAIIAGSAVNQDGASGGLTVPNGPAQQRVIRSAIARAGRSEADIDYVEAHGSGTPLGDPVEMHALGEVFSAGRDASRPLWVGSAKSNLGHMEAAAGVGGLIKTVLQIKNATIAPNLHFTNPSSKIQWAKLPVKVPTRAIPWPAGRPRRAGVSSFGMSGTNAHVVLEEAPGTQTDHGAGARASSADIALPALLSGRTEGALRAQARQLREHLERHPDMALVDVAHSLALARTHFEHRAGIVAHHRQELLESLDALARGELSVASPTAHAVRGVSAAPRGGGKVVFVFPGQGSQWAGMARPLLRTSEVFRAQIEACERAFSPYVDWSLSAVLEGREANEGGASLERVDVVQPVLFAVMVSLAAVWQTLGVAPDAVIGHSQGEIAAAFVAGALSLEDAARVVTLRSRALLQLAGKGAMAAVQLSAPELQVHLDRLGARERLSIASINGPRATVISGDPSAVDALLERLTAEQVFARKVRVDYASHGASIEAVEGELLAQLGSIRPRPASIPFYSTVTSTVLAGTALGASYWYRNLRQTVRFADTAQTSFDDGHRFFVEVSPHPVLSLALLEMFESAPAPSSGAVTVTVAGSLRRDEGDFARLVGSLAELHVRGLRVDWDRFFRTRGGRKVQLPTYPFQREAFWFEFRSLRKPDLTSSGLMAAKHPLLRAVVARADGDGVLFTGILSLREQPWLSGHVVFGTVIVPGTAFVELALTAAHHLGLDRVDELTLEAPLALPPEGTLRLQLSVSAPDETGRRSFALHVQPAGDLQGALQDGSWTRHATGFLGGAAPGEAPFELHTWPPPGGIPLPIEGLYARLAGAGLVYGAAFQGLRAVWKDGDTLFAEVELPHAAAKEADRFALHPALLDAALHALAAERIDGAADVALPFAWSGVSLRAVGASTLRVRFERVSEPADAVALFVADAAGEPVARIESLTRRTASAEHVRGARGSAAQVVHRDALWRLEWIPLPNATPPVQSRHWALVDAAWVDAAADAGAPGPADAVFEALTAAGAVRCHRYSHFAALQRALAGGAATPDAVVLPFLSLLPLRPLPTPQDIAAAAHEATRRALDGVQRWLADERLASCSLVVITRGTLATHAYEDIADLVHAPLWGLLRSAQTENPDRRIVLVDMDDSADSWRSLLTGFDPTETQLALRAGHRLAPRMVHRAYRPHQAHRAPRAAPDALPVPADAAWHLEAQTKGTLESLALVPYPPAQAPVGPGQVRVAVHAAGLNFRDVLDALGMYPGEARPLGGEGAGVVLEVGEGVTNVAAGDRVLGLLPAAFGPIAITDHRLIARMPEGWSFVEAAGVSVVFLTAYYALVDLARLRAGESVLVHAAAGGVGMAATQLARHLGAEVFATASPGKWETLRELGFDEAHRASSRTTAFEDHFRRVTDGRGVDVVLDSLARELVDASLRLLPRGGRFIEMGKTDLRDAHTVGIEHPGVAYRAFDLAEAGADRIQEMLGELMALFARGVLRPLPTTVRDIRHAPHAFRSFGQARHVGKMVFTLPRPIDPEGTVLITGGTGTLGALLARHLVQRHGAKHLLLTSRQGLRAEGATALVAELEELGARVSVAACDVADRGALEALLNAIAPEHPLGAVVHAAGILDDGVVTSLTHAKLESVLRAKIDGATHLHELTQSRDLSAFILFSSLSGVLGTPGQANYAAANAFLDALAHHRRARGLPALALDWGYWAEKSQMTAHLSHVDVQRMARGGVLGLSSREGLALFDAALACPDSVLAPARFDMAALAELEARPDTLPPVLRGMAGARASRPLARNAARASSRERGLRAMPAAEREEALRDLVRTEAATVLGMTGPGSLDLERPLQGIGLDSLMAVELRNRLMAVTGLRLPATLFFEAPTVHKAATRLARMMHDAPAPGESAAKDVANERGANEHDANEGGANERGALDERAMIANVRRLWQHNEMDIGDELLAASARIRRAREVGEARAAKAPPPCEARPSKTLQLARGAASPPLFCISALVPIPAAMTYARLASALDGSRDIRVLPHPGYGAGEPLPSDGAAIARAEADEILRSAPDGNVAILGYSAGGWIAHDVVRHLESAGVFPTALVLIDTYTMHGISPRMRSMFRSNWLNAFPSASWTDGELTAYAWYRHLYDSWRPSPIAARTLFVRATEPMPGMDDTVLSPGHDWRSSWAEPHDAVDVPGHHFNVLSDHAAAVARAIDDWLTRSLAAAPRAVPRRRAQPEPPRDGTLREPKEIR